MGKLWNDDSMQTVTLTAETDLEPNGTVDSPPWTTATDDGLDFALADKDDEPNEDDEFDDEDDEEFGDDDDLEEDFDEIDDDLEDDEDDEDDDFEDDDDDDEGGIDDDAF